ERSDFATDVSVRKAGIDPSTGARYLEELSFEVVSTQSLRHITVRAEDISGRGVRRFFAIFVKKKQVAEWSAAEGAWKPLASDGSIEDECLVLPMPVQALLDPEQAEIAVARALLIKKNRRIEEALEDARVETLIRSAERLCRVLDVPLDDPRRAALQRMNASALEALLDDLARDRRWPG
ncbi:MAG TPA: hypothetical protein VLS89_09400, partial [Candidatus Nanopelagicales bacterium]|nr:hypothetical protein [Candidatus Nanopelagicales bacterium]